MSHAILFIVHGSRREASNEEMRMLAKSLAKRTGKQVQIAYLELCHPLIGEAIDLLAEQGTTHIDVLPYFLAAGKHVVRDVPNAVTQAQEKHPHLTLTIQDYAGKHPRIIEALSHIVEEVA